MHRKDDQGRGDFEVAFSPVPHASGFRMILALATQNNMHCDHVDISQAFVQGDLLPGDEHNGKVYISAPPGFEEDPNYVYLLRRPLYGMPIAARAWHHTMSAYLKSQRCNLVGFERSMWTVVKEGHVILFTAHIDDLLSHARTDGFWMNSVQRFFNASKELMQARCTLIWDAKFSVTKKQARPFCLRNIMVKTSCAHMTIGTVFLPSLLWYQVLDWRKNNVTHILNLHFIADIAVL
jgi:hypothetical protein